MYRELPLDFLNARKYMKYEKNSQNLFCFVLQEHYCSTQLRKAAEYYEIIITNHIRDCCFAPGKGSW